VSDAVRRAAAGWSTSSLGDAESSLGDAKSSLGDAKSSLGDAKSSLGDAESSLGDAKSSLGDAESSLGGAKSSLGDAEISLGDAESSHHGVVLARQRLVLQVLHVALHPRVLLDLRGAREERHPRVVFHAHRNVEHVVRRAQTHRVRLDARQLVERLPKPIISGLSKWKTVWIGPVWSWLIWWSNPTMQTLLYDVRHTSQ
jgi:hypothetical protein